MPRRSASPSVVWIAIRSAAVATALLRFVVACSPAAAVTTSWNTNSSGLFTTASNWTNGVPDGDDTAVFNRGAGVAYTVTFPGGSVFDPAPNYVIDRLHVRQNDVTFRDNSSPFITSPSLTVANPDASTVIGENPGEVAVLTTSLRSLSGGNVSIARAPGVDGTLNVIGGSFHGDTIIVGEGGMGRLNVTNGGVVSATNLLQVNRSGQLAGIGRIQGNVQISGRIAPGNSVGTLHIDGDYGQLSEGELFVEIAAADSFDKLDINGNVTLNGRLHVSLLPGYSPEEGDTFDILDWTGTQFGKFSDFELPRLSAGLGWSTSQLQTSGILSVVPAYFQHDDFITYSQDNWGTVGTPAAQLLLNSFFDIYPNGVSLGIPGTAGHSVVWDTPEAVFDYLPATGDPGPFDNDLQNPVSTSAGSFGGRVLALQLDVDFSDDGFLSGSAGISFGDLILHNLIIDFGGLIGDVDMTAFNGFTVRQYLAEMNHRLGGESGPYSYDEIGFLTNQLTRSFESGTPSQFAQDHLRFPGDFNRDLKVDAADYVVWRKTDGTPTGYNEWRANFGWTAGSPSGPSAAESAGGAVPEPTGALMLLVGCTCLFPLRQSRESLLCGQNL